MVGHSRNVLGHVVLGGSQICGGEVEETRGRFMNKLDDTFFFARTA